MILDLNIDNFSPSDYPQETVGELLSNYKRYDTDINIYKIARLAVMERFGVDIQDSIKLMAPSLKHNTKIPKGDV